MDPIMPTFVGSIAAILLFGLLLKRLGQPHILGYVIAGVVLGPAGLGFVEDTTTINRIGDIGVVLLLFFAGMEVSLPNLIARWHVPVLGTLLQIATSVGCALAIGVWQGWPFERGILLGFVISLSSTAVVLKLLRDSGDMEEPTGRDVVGILLAQDLAVIPMLIAVGMLGGSATDTTTVVTQIIGGIAAIGLLVLVARAQTVRLPLGAWLRADKELQVFGAFLLGFGFAFLTSMAGLSVALGAFVAGIVVGAARETHWVHEVLYPFQVLFLAVFFVSIGMMLDLGFIWRERFIILFLLIAVLLINTSLNALILRALGRGWRHSLYGGALLAQVGEFSFVLAAIGAQTGIIGRFSYQITVAVIALSLFTSPAWISLGRRFRGHGTDIGAPKP